MDWKQFIASIVGSVAWPLATIVILAMFREQFRKLIAQIRKFGAGGVNIELAEKVEEVVAQAELVDAEKGDKSAGGPELDASTVELLQQHPSMAVLQEYKAMEAILLQIRSRVPEGTPKGTLPHVLRYLIQEKFISASVMGLFQREARNAVVHSNEKEISYDEALSLVRSARRLTEIFERVLDRLPRSSNRT